MKNIENNLGLFMQAGSGNLHLNPIGGLLFPDIKNLQYKPLKEDETDPEDNVELDDSDTNDPDEDMNEKDFEDDVSGSDLDVPGSELDDEQEDVGSEDEENNYYSLGGDSHDDLEENRDDY